MRVVLVNYAHHPRHLTPDAVLDDYRTLTGWAEGVSAAGPEVVAVQGFTHDARVEREGVRYELSSNRAFSRWGRLGVPGSLHRRVVGLGPDVVHVNGLIYPLQILDLRRRLPATCAVVVQHHAERPASGLWGSFQGAVLRRCVDGFLFTVQSLAEPWVAAGRITANQPIWEIVEGSSTFEVAERPPAREHTGMEGNPICLWVANLDSNKDPLTVLRGFEQFLQTYPEARLYMAYRRDALLGEVLQALAASDRLGAAVELLGRLPYDELEPVFNSADFFLQGSHREGSGYALADALACGVIPVVTDIPSFRFMTGGQVGALWPPGDAAALASALNRLAAASLHHQRRGARSCFDERLSFTAVGKLAAEAYRQALARRQRSPS